MLEIQYAPPQRQQFANVARYETLRPTNDQLRLATIAAEEILRRTQVRTGDCTYMSAMWTAMLRDAQVSAFCVSGDLIVRGTPAFASENPDVARSLDASTDEWDAHCWMVLGEYIGDASIFRTAYARPVNSNLRRVVEAEFGQGRGFLLLPAAQLHALGFDYRPKHVVTEVQINGLIRGASATGFAA